MSVGRACQAGRTAGFKKLPLRELTEQARLQQIAPAGALINGHGDILYLHGRTGRYLEPALGACGYWPRLKALNSHLK